MKKQDRNSLKDESRKSELLTVGDQENETDRETVGTKIT